MSPLDRIALVYESASTAGLPGTRKAILLYVAFRDGGSGCSASVARMVAETGFSERTIQRELRVLEAAGLIRGEQSFGATTTYFLGGASVAPPSQWHPRQCDTPVAVAPVPMAPKQEENRNGMNRKEHLPPSSPKGGEAWEEDPLFGEWARVAEVAAENPSLSMPAILKKTKPRLSELRSIDEALGLLGKTWGDLRAGARRYSLSNGYRLMAGTKRLLANDYEDLRSVLEAAVDETPQPIPPWKGDDR